MYIEPLSPGADAAQVAWRLRASLDGLTPSDVAASLTADHGQHLAAPAQWPVHVAQAVARRRREFLLGRHCAGEALRRLGHPTTEVSAASDRSPVWPAGTTGSISHAGGLAIALAGPSQRYSGIGVDIEQTGRLLSDLWDHIFDGAEIAGLEACPPQLRDVVATLIFSAKESYYKAQYAERRERLGFHDVHIELQDGGFRTTDRRKPQGPPMTGHFASAPGFVMTALVIVRRSD